MKPICWTLDSASTCRLHPFRSQVNLSPQKQEPYRVRETKTDKGDYLLEMDKGDGWQIGYAFSLTPIDEAVLTCVRDAIFDEEASPFNKNPLASKLIKDGKLILTKDHFTKQTGGGLTKEDVNAGDFQTIFVHSFFD